jgi:hypothetical protein
VTGTHEPHNRLADRDALPGKLPGQPPRSGWRRRARTHERRKRTRAGLRHMLRVTVALALSQSPSHESGCTSS